MSFEELLLNRSTTDRPWPVVELDGDRLTDRYRFITAAQGSAATVRFGPEGRSEATYQVRISKQSNTEVRQNYAASGCLHI